MKMRQKIKKKRKKKIAVNKYTFNLLFGGFLLTFLKFFLDFYWDI